MKVCTHLGRRSRIYLVKKKGGGDVIDAPWVRNVVKGGGVECC